MHDPHDFAGLRAYALAHPLVRRRDGLTERSFRFLPGGITVGLSFNR